MSSKKLVYRMSRPKRQGPSSTLEKKGLVEITMIVIPIPTAACDAIELFLVKEDLFKWRRGEESLACRTSNTCLFPF